jgi:hypothetical protein
MMTTMTGTTTKVMETTWTEEKKEWKLHIHNFCLLIIQEEADDGDHVYFWQWHIYPYNVPIQGLEFVAAKTFWGAIEASHNNIPDEELLSLRP